MALIAALLFVLFLALGVPIAASLGLASLIAVLATNKVPLVIVAQMVYASADSFSLMAIPFFMLAGTVMEAGGLSRRLINFANCVVGGTTGGLGAIAVLTSMFFAAISGSGPATVAALGTILIPAMIEAGYDAAYASALMATAGAIGIIIPPSIPMVVYGVQSDVSVGALFLGGFLPGILFGGVLLAYNYVRSKHQQWGGTSRSSLREAMLAAKDALPALLMPVIVLGGIYGGVFTPTEAAAVAVVYGVMVGRFVYKELDWGKFAKALVDAGINSAVVVLIIMGASIFSWIIVSENVPTLLVDFVRSISRSSVVVLLLINVLLLIAGCLLDASSAIIVLTPLLLPVIKAFNVDPLHFGIIMVVNLAIGLVTPPVGLDLYVAAGIAKLSLEQISRAVIPLIVVVIVALLVTTYVPSLSLALPHLLK